MESQKIISGIAVLPLLLLLVLLLPFLLLQPSLSIAIDSSCFVPRHRKSRGERRFEGE